MTVRGLHHWIVKSQKSRSYLGHPTKMSLVFSQKTYLQHSTLHITTHTLHFLDPIPSHVIIMDELQFTMAIALLNTNVVSCYDILMQMPLVEKWVTTSAISPPTLLQSDYLKTMTLSHGTCWHQAVPLLRPTVYHQYPKPLPKYQIISFIVA